MSPKKPTQTTLLKQNQVHDATVRLSESLKRWDALHLHRGQALASGIILAEACRDLLKKLKAAK